MANFCSKCGAPVTGPFCGRCGAAIQQTTAQAQNHTSSSAPVQQVAPAPAAVPPPQSATAPARTGGSSAAAKVIFVLLGIVLFFGIAIVGSLVYVGYRAKQKIAQLKTEYGIENQTASSGGSSERIFPPSKGNGCKLLEGQEAAKVLGVAVDRAETEPTAPDGSVSCRYWVTAEERQRLVTQELASGLTNMGDPNTKSGQSDIETLIGGAAGALNEANGDNKNGDYAFSLQVWQKDGKQHWAKIEAAQAQAKNALGDGGAAVAMQSVQGIGDRAIELPAGHSIMVLKGDAFFLLGFQQFVPGQEKTAALARIVVMRM
jgi:hypothetical protein